MRASRGTGSRWLLGLVGLFGWSCLPSTPSPEGVPSVVEAPESEPGVVRGFDEALSAQDITAGCGSCPAGHICISICRLGTNETRVIWGSWADISWYIQNTTASAKSVRVAHYLVRADGWRRLVRVASYVTPPPGSAATVHERILVPLDTPPGPLAVEMALDPYNEIAEASETNNTLRSVSGFLEILGRP